MNLDINPYYSSNKNNNINDICSKEVDIQSISSIGNLVKKNWSPYDSPIESQRGNSIYNAHSYPTKIDYRSIMKYILYHTKPGDVVLDPFSGSGTTGVAAVQCGRTNSEVITEMIEKGKDVEVGERKALLIDLSTLATFISSSLLIKCDEKLFKEYINNILKETETELSWMYEVEDEDGEIEVVRQIIWSEVFKCPECNHESTYWGAGVDAEEKKFKDILVCPNCKCNYEKNISNKIFEVKEDILNGNMVESVKRKPIRIYVQKGKTKYYREPNERDMELIEKIENFKIKSWIPNVKMMFKDGNWGEMYRSGYHKGITHVHHFYTKRNLIAISSLWEKAMNAPQEIRNKILFVISSYNLSNATLMTRAVFKSNCKDLVITGAQNGQLYLGSISVEKNVFRGIREVKLSTIIKAFTELGWGSENIRISTQSNDKIDIPDNSIDYILTDPPFGQDIIYSEMNFISEAWLGNYTNNENETIICRAQGKDVNVYEKLIKKSFCEMYRVLKNGKSASIVFHNSKKEVWNATLRALNESGFKVVNTSILDKKQGSIKQVKSKNAVSKVIVIHVVKVEGEIAIDSINIDVWEYIDEVVKEYPRETFDNSEKYKQYLYSVYLAYLIKNDKDIDNDAKGFYVKLEERYKKI